jgi:phosphoribosylamine--glycine ligase
MGAIAPVQKFRNNALDQKIKYKIIEPVLKAMDSSGSPFTGCLYCGLMIVDNEPFVIEFNCRFGDPETQAVLPLIKSDFLEMLISSARGEIENYIIEENNQYSCCVVLASEGYPDSYDNGKVIEGIDQVENDCLIFHSGTKVSIDGKHILSNGGRVLSVVGLSKISLQNAVDKAYADVNKINFENKYYRKDIGFKQAGSEYRGEAI